MLVITSSGFSLKHRTLPTPSPRQQFQYLQVLHHQNTIKPKNYNIRSERLISELLGTEVTGVRAFLSSINYDRKKHHVKSYAKMKWNQQTFVR